MGLEGLHYEIKRFKELHNCEEKDLMIVMSEVYTPEGYSRLKHTTLFGIEIQFSPYVDDVLIARKFDPKFLGFEGLPNLV